MTTHGELISIVAGVESIIRSYRERIAIRGLTHKDVVIAVLSVDDRCGYLLAKALVGDSQEAEWQAQRESGRLPLCIGLVERDLIQRILNGQKPLDDILRAMDEVAIFVVAAGAFAVLAVDPAWT